MRPFDLLIFDFNGTLQDDLHYIYECGPRRIFKKFGLYCPSLDEYRAEVGGDFMSSFYWPRGIPREVSAKDLNEIMKQAMKEHGEPPHLFLDALEALEAVVKSGCQSVLVSAYDSAKLADALRRHGLEKRFSHVSGDIRDKAAEFVRLMDACGVAPERTAAVGDTVEDAAAAAGAGVTPFVCPRGFHTRERIEALRTDIPTLVVIENLAALADRFRY